MKLITEEGGNPLELSPKQRKKQVGKLKKKSHRIYDHVSMGTLAENLVSNPKPEEI